MLLLLLYLYLRAELLLWYMVKEMSRRVIQYERRWGRDLVVFSKLSSEREGKNMNEAANLSGSPPYSETGCREKHKHLYSWNPSTFNLFLALWVQRFTVTYVKEITKYNWIQWTSHSGLQIEHALELNYKNVMLIFSVK